LILLGIFSVVINPSDGEDEDSPLKLEMSSQDSFVSELADYCGVQDHHGLAVRSVSGGLTRINALSLLPPGDKLVVSIETKFKKTFMVLAST